MGPVTNHDAAIAPIEAAFAEFEEEKADIYEMGKIAKVSSCHTKHLILNLCLVLNQRPDIMLMGSSYSFDMKKPLSINFENIFDNILMFVYKKKSEPK